ncbi:MAG: hypothetical protein ACRDAQ_00530 [Cetobacterium sp.]
MTQEEIQKIKEDTGKEIKSVLDQLENDVPGASEGMAAMMGTGVGGAASYAALYGLGTVGLSAAGITSGLATAGAIVGGGMVAGIGVLAAPIALLGIGGFALAKKRKTAKLIAALTLAISKLHNIQTKLYENAQYYKEEIEALQNAIDRLIQKKKKAA